jgi:hypothetical protein
MSTDAKKTKLELTWIGKENRAKLEPRILLEDAEKSYHAPHRATDHDLFDNRPISGDNRDKASLDIFWLRDESLEDFDNLPDSDVLAHKIVDNLEAGFEQFREITNDLGREDAEPVKK